MRECRPQMCARIGFLVLVLLAACPAAGQTVGTCARGEADAYLDVGNVRARIVNTGGLFYRGSPYAYEVPKGSGTHALFAAALWVAGLADGELRAAATHYGAWEFWPGPLDADGNPPADCTPYDRLFSVYRADVETYDATGASTADLRDWPYALGAPVLDGDGDPSTYDLAGGDRPVLRGDQSVWWVMNDLGNTHLTTKGPPIGLEIRGTAWAFRERRSHLDTITFYRFEMHYRGEVPLEEAYLGFWVDADLGLFSDDLVGCDTLLHLGYTYNAIEVDRDYGPAPPAIGYTFLRTPADPDGRDSDFDGEIDEPGEAQGMTTYLWYNDGGGVTGKPQRGKDYYLYMQARWKDGHPLTYGGRGRDPSGTPTRFSYPGDPYLGEGWTELDPAGDGSLPPHADTTDPAQPGGDRWGMMATGPFTLSPGETEEVVVAVVWSRGANHLDSVRQLKADVANLRRYADVFLEPVAVPPDEPPPGPSPVLGFAPNVPNPFREATTIRFSLPAEAYVRLAVYDVLGREVAVLVEGRQGSGGHAVAVDASGWPPGVYVARLQVGAYGFSRTMLRTR